MSVHVPPTRAGTIHVIGCNHGIQNTNEENLHPVEVAGIRTQRLHFNRLLEATVTNNNIQFIGEEWGLPQSSAAQVLSERSGISWTNINTSPEDLNRMGIPADYVYRPYDLATKAQWTKLREEFMSQKIIENKGNAKNLMIICGFHHLQPLAGLLADLACEVQTIDYRDLYWYRSGIFSDDE